MKAVLAAMVLVPLVSLPALADAPKKKKQAALKPASLAVRSSSSAGSSASSSRNPAQIDTPKPVPVPLYREDLSLEEMQRYHQ